MKNRKIQVRVLAKGEVSDAPMLTAEILKRDFMRSKGTNQMNLSQDQKDDETILDVLKRVSTDEC